MDVGEVAFNARTVANADGGDSGIFNTVGGSLFGVAFEGQTAPDVGGSDADLRFSDFPSAWPPTINRSGELAFFARTAPNGKGVFSTVGGGLQSVAFDGQVAPIETTDGDGERFPRLCASYYKRPRRNSIPSFHECRHRHIQHGGRRREDGGARRSES